MKYFLPQWYVQLNSPDEALADAAEEAIDRADEQYGRRWEEIKAHLPPRAVQFYDEQDLHDADVFAPGRMVEAAGAWRAGDVVLVAQQSNTLNADFRNTLVFLRYAVTDEPQVEIPVRSEVFRRVQPIWLYDEFDMERPGVFTHSILISDGRVVVIRFRDFDYQLATIIGPSVPAGLGMAKVNIGVGPAA